MTTPKSPEQIMRDIYEYALTDEHNWSCVAYSEGQLCCIHERHEEKQVFEKLLRSSMSSLLCYTAERMNQRLSVNPIPELEGADAVDCEVRNDIVGDCAGFLIEEARKITNNE